MEIKALRKNYKWVQINATADFSCTDNVWRYCMKYCMNIKHETAKGIIEFIPQFISFQFAQQILLW